MTRELVIDLVLFVQEVIKIGLKNLIKKEFIKPELHESIVSQLSDLNYSGIVVYSDLMNRF